MNDNQVMHAMSLDDAYRVVRVLARGAGGVTELVTIDGAGPFVRKKMSLDMARRRVWSALGDCSSARVPHVEATYELPDAFVVVYDFVPGETLETHVSQVGAMESARAVKVARGICEGVAELHAHGIIHRDLTPANIIIAADGPHLIDLGIARMRVEGATRDTTSLGTWGYASPEQYGFAQTDARSDVYSIGRVLGFLLCGVRPDADEFEAALEGATAAEPWLRSVIAKACAFEPSARYQSADELAAALAAGDEGAVKVAAVAETPSQKSGDTDANVVASPAKRRTPRSFIVAAVVIAAALAVAAGLWLASRESEAKSGASSQISETSGGESSGTGISRGSSTSSDSTGTAPTAESATLEVVESGWHADSSGYIDYAVTIRNTSSGRAIEAPAVKVVGRDSLGAVIFSTTEMFGALNAGQKATYAGIAGNGTTPASVDFEPVQPQEEELTNPVEQPELTISDANAVTADGVTTFTGTLTVEGKGSAYSSVYLSAILRDESGNIVGSCNNFCDLPADGETTAFEIEAANLPGYATYELYAEPW